MIIDGKHFQHHVPVLSYCLFSVHLAHLFVSSFLNFEKEFFSKEFFSVREKLKREKKRKKKEAKRGDSNIENFVD